MEYKQIRNLNGKDQWQQPTFTWEGFTLYLSLDLSPSMSPAYLGALCGFSLSWKSNLHLSVVPLPEDSVFTQGGGEGGAEIHTHVCIKNTHTHRKEGKHPRMLGRLHHTQWGDTGRAKWIKDNSLFYYTHSLLNGMWVQQYLLKKEKGRWGGELIAVKYCQKTEN